MMAFLRWENTEHEEISLEEWHEKLQTCLLRSMSKIVMRELEMTTQKTAGLRSQELFYASLAIGVFVCGHCRSQRAGGFKLE